MGVRNDCLSCNNAPSKQQKLIDDLMKYLHLIITQGIPYCIKQDLMF